MRPPDESGLYNNSNENSEKLPNRTASRDFLIRLREVFVLLWIACVLAGFVIIRLFGSNTAVRFLHFLGKR
jgi:hypothetical protein